MRTDKVIPRQYEERIKTRFLWFPKEEICNGTISTRWLETASWVEIYRSFEEGSEWCFDRWIDVPKN